MTKASDNAYPSILIAEAVDPAAPAASHKRLFIDTDHKLKTIDSSSVVVDYTPGAAGSVATDAIWDAAGDMVVGTGADTAGRVAVGADSTVWTVSPTTHVPVWAAPAAGLVVAANEYVGTAPYFSNKTNVSPTANRATFMRFLCLSNVTVAAVYFQIAVQAGDLDFGIYDASLNRLASTGSFACPAAGNRSQALTGALAMTAGTVYYLAIVATSATMNLYCVSFTGIVASGGWNLSGRMEAAFPLPNPITVTAWEDSAFYPVIYFK